MGLRQETEATGATMGMLTRLDHDGTGPVL